MAAAVAEFVSVTKGPTVAHRPLPFVLQLVRTHQASGTRQRLVHALFFLPGIFDRRTRASIEYELKLLCKLIINFHFIITTIVLNAGKTRTGLA